MASAYKKGDRVRLWQVKKSEYEGKEGTIAGKYNRRKKRWPVKLDFNGKTVNVEPKNLRKGRPLKKEMSPPEIMEKATGAKKRRKSASAKKENGEASTKKEKGEASTKKEKEKKKKSEKKKTEAFKVGDRVQLVNVTKKSYEGKMGTISGEFLKKKSRWPVKLDEGKKVNLKGDNLQLVKNEEEEKQEAGATDDKAVEADEEQAEESAPVSQQADEEEVAPAKDAEAAEPEQKEEEAADNSTKALNQANDEPEPSEAEVAAAASAAETEENKENDDKDEANESPDAKSEKEKPAVTEDAPEKQSENADNNEDAEKDPDPAESKGDAPDEKSEKEAEEAVESENATEKPSNKDDHDPSVGGAKDGAEEADAANNEEVAKEAEPDASEPKEDVAEPDGDKEEAAEKEEEAVNDAEAAAKEETNETSEKEEEVQPTESESKANDDAEAENDKAVQDAEPESKDEKEEAAGKEEEVKAAEPEAKADNADDPASAEKEEADNNSVGGGPAGGAELPDENAAPPPEADDEVEQRSEEKHIDFSKFAKLLPVDRTHEETQRRHKMFTDIDQSANGHLSLAEIEVGIKNFLGEDIYLMKPAIKMAYKSARGIAPEEDHDDDAFVEFKEFRIFLSMVRQYIELYAAFDTIDSGDDHRISIKEFETSLDMLADWGIKIEDPEKTFSEIDTNGGGQVLFEEFCRWALKKHLDYDKSFDEGDDEAVAKKVEIDKDEEEYKPYEPENKSEDEQRSEKEIDLAKFASLLPVGRTHDETQTRNKMFDDMDVSSNGQLSLAEIDTGIQSFLGENLDMGPAIRMAYKVSKGIDPNGDGGGDYVDFSEFRILLVSVRQYIQLNAAFDAIDSGDDHRIDFSEFSTALDMLKDWGITIEDPEKAFDEIDSNDGGQVLFEEFCIWAMKKGLDYDDELQTGDAKAVKKSVDIDESEKSEESAPKKAPVKRYEKIELDEIAAKLPVGRSNEDAVERKRMFDAMDVSANDQLSLAEIDLGILNELGEEFHLMKPAICMAYKSSRGVDPRESMDGSYVEFSEFRILLCNIRRYIELFGAFEAVDDGDDNRINLEEFSNSLGMLKEWGIEIENPEETFKSIDENGGGQVLFNEFAHWALKTGLDYDKDLDEGDAKAVMQEVDVPEDPDEVAKEEEEVEAKEEIKVSIDFEAMAAKLPAGDSAEDRKSRKKLFSSIDSSGSGALSLAEIELGVLSYVGEEAAMLKKAIRMAYKVAKEGRGGKEDDYVERKEMKTLMICLQRYFELWAAFEAVDTGDDKRINFDEFSKSVDVLKKWNVEIEDPKAEFDAIDSNDGGQVLFGEFCTWALKKNLDVDDEEDSEE